MALVLMAQLKGSGKLIVTVGEDIRAYGQPVARDPFDRVSASVNLRVESLDDDRATGANRIGTRLGERDGAAAG